MLEKFLCFDLRTGVLAYGALSLIYSLFAAMIHFVLSLQDDNPQSAADQTFYLVGNFINLLLTASLTYGVYKEHRVFLLPFLILSAIVYAVMTTACIFFVIYVPVLALILPFLAFCWYVWYAVLSLYQLWDPHNPNYMPQQLPATVVYVEDTKPPSYYENMSGDAV